jgi:MinD superfamily P-loop ATPase
MKIAVASGKGGTGKTTVAVSCAALLSERGEMVSFVDCDVEEPNGHLFLKPEIRETHVSSIPVPHIDASRCIGCGTCVRFCRFSALVRLGTTVMTIPELCHGCGGCAMICPNHAITGRAREIGGVASGIAGAAAFTQGTLKIGEAMSPPLIRDTLKRAPDAGVTIIDAPPGTSCPVVTTIRHADFVVLVAESTPFGLNDLSLALDMVRVLKRPHGVVINRADVHAGDAREFCAARRTVIMAEIPDDRRIAEACSRGEMPTTVAPDIRALFLALCDTIMERARRLPAAAGGENREGG